MEMALSNVCLSIFNGLKYNTSPRRAEITNLFERHFIFGKPRRFCCQLLLSLSFTSSMAFIKPKWDFTETFL